MLNIYARFSLVLSVSVCCITLTFGYPIFAHVSTLALTGDEAVGTDSAVWSYFGLAHLNNSGAVAFNAFLAQDDTVTPLNDAGVWLFDPTDSVLLARSGVGSVVGGGNAPFAAFHYLQLDESGNVYNVAKLAFIPNSNEITSANNFGIWRFGVTDSELVARTGSGNVPGLPGADYTGFRGTKASASNFAISDNGQISFVGTLAIGIGGVTSNNSKGLWTHSQTTQTLIARNGSGNVPGVPNADFNSFGLPAINNDGHLGLLASLKVGVGGVSSDSALGIWRYTDTAGELLVRTASSNVPGTGGATFVTLDEPFTNNHGDIVFSARHDYLSDAGVWLFPDDSNAATPLARTDTGLVPGVPSAEFFGPMTVDAFNDQGQALITATLAVGVGGVTEDNKEGLWLVGNDARLVARQGTSNAPGIPGSSFANFYARALNEQNDVAFIADLAIGGDIDETNDLGLWISHSDSDDQLIARKGDLLAGRTIDSLGFLGDGNTNTVPIFRKSLSTGFNDAGELVFRATFTNGDSGLFLFRPYAADFDRDADVDAADLTEWEIAFAATSVADADNDDDSDGADFLVWQREFGSGTALQPISVAVPEPASWLLFAVGLLCNRRRK